MYKIITALFCLCMAWFAQAQTVTIVDRVTLQPVQGVEVFNSTKNNSLGKSGNTGTVELSGLGSKDLIIFVHPLYLRDTLSGEELKNVDFLVRLTENLYSIDEVVVSASKFEEKRKDVAQKIQVVRATELQTMNQS